jgi:predicted RNA binding protein YcfA (HicA-like mRNA interferase family)
MPPLPTLSGRDVVKAFANAGWQMVRQRGSHMIMVKDGHRATLSVPDHHDVRSQPMVALDQRHCRPQNLGERPSG